ncbi:energy-coupling factor transporter transmembrane protein EcfT [uncultured Limosilactobacillus sp.]|uniref:energy-coupling factor transporter transmembrane component T family protein n=1 Tax=uncultured Limosilactobacillus sp. TaxID=2837629 RepID=UPI0025D6A6BA|nr:energy-coupling factor transporter transmembrane component T [uncultured Limosilactobacillus sp.]
MGSKVIFGRYVPTSSIIHRLDPRLKFVACFWYVILVFFANNVWTNVWLGAILLVLIKLSRVSLKMYWAGIRPLMWIIIITAAVQLLFSSGGQIYWQWHFMSVTSSGIVQSLYLIVRFAYIITISTVLTVTTTTLQLADAIESLMKPLNYLKVPVNQIAMMLSIALRFIPTIMDEVSTIMNAQRARGMDFNTGNFYQRAKKLVPVMIPLFVSAFKRAEELAVAMEARGYSPNGQRTKYRLLVWHRQDTLAIILLIAITLILFGLRLF